MNDGLRPVSRTALSSAVAAASLVLTAVLFSSSDCSWAMVSGSDRTEVSSSPEELWISAS